MEVLQQGQRCACLRLLESCWEPPSSNELLPCDTVLGGSITSTKPHCNDMDTIDVKYHEIVDRVVTSTPFAGRVAKLDP